MSSQKTRYVESIIATTHQVRDTIILTDALEGAARQINESHRKIVMLAEHDHTCPPLGVTIAARVVQIDGGHHALQTITALYGDPKEIELPDSSIGLLQELVEYPHPLTSGESTVNRFFYQQQEPYLNSNSSFSLKKLSWSMLINFVGFIKISSCDNWVFERILFISRT
jgi:hypothetical protein